MDMGVGKTLPTLCRILELLKDRKIEKALVVAPIFAMGAWYRDMELFGTRDRQLLEKSISVINYESVWRKNRGYNHEWGCVVLDESHKIKNRTSKQSAFLLKLSLKAKYRYILTGTPIGNGQLENLWSQYAFIEPTVNRGRVSSKIFGTYSQFLDRYCILNQYWKPYRYLNVDEFQDIMYKHCYSVKKKDCLDLPEKLPDEVFEIQPKEKKLYKEMAEHSTIENMDILAENPLARMSKLRSIASGFINDNNGKTHELKCDKTNALKDFLDGWDKKLVIFCEFKYSIKTVSESLDKLKIKYVTLDGEQKDKQIWRKFQSDESIQIIICQYQSASQGIDLYSADTMIFYEPTLSSTLLEQAKDRIHRGGQTSKCSYIHFITKSTIERAIYRSLKNFTDFNEKLFTEYMKEYQKSYSGRK